MSSDTFGMSEGGKVYKEPCVAEDMDKIGKLNKDALAVFAKKKFNINIDRGTNISILRGDLVKKVQIALNLRVADPEIGATERAQIEKVIPRFVMHPKNHRIFDATEALLLRNDMIPCEEDGTPIYHYAMPVKEKRKPRNELDRLSLDLERQIV
jgi:hypothetical protein